MKKPLKIAIVTVAALVAVPVLLVATTATVDAVATSSETSSIGDYGERVTVDGRRMNVLVSGDHDQTIVLLPGLGTTAPALDFEPLIDELDETYRVVAVEPFGTGLSDQTDVPRTAENITREVHEALQQLGVDRYVLMGHSIAGIYALTYTAAYPDEIVAFVGIDSSVPDQPGSEEPIPSEAMVLLSDLGITRALQSIAPDPYEGADYDEATVERMRGLAARNATAPTLVDEMDHAVRNFADVSGATFARELPVLLFVVSDEEEVDGWVELHERQAATVERGEVVLLEGDHYLHRTRSPEIAAATGRFLEQLER